MPVGTPTVLWEEWPIVAIVIFIIFAVAIGGFVFIKWLLKWQSDEAQKSRELIAAESERSRTLIAAESERSRSLVAAETEKNRIWQAEQQKNQQQFLVAHDERRDAQNEKRDALLAAVAESLKTLQTTNDEMIDAIKVHHAVVEEIAKQAKPLRPIGALR
jgi:hypothetical protein